MADSRESIQASMRSPSLKTQFKTLPKAEPSQRRIVGRNGLGAPPDYAKISSAASLREGLGDLVDAIQQSVMAPVWNMDVIEQVRWNLQGPLTPAAVTQNFGTEIDLFGSGKAVPGIDFVETTMAQTGQLQTYMVTCYLGVHLEPEPLCFSAQGNAWTHPTVSTTQPPSPDVFTANDVANGALGAAIAAGTQTFLPAVLEWGWWANYAAWHLSRGYNLRWKIGQHTNIMDEVLRHTAYMPPSAQEGSASSSEVDIADFVRRLNTRYDALGSGLDFLKLNRIRLGSVGAAPNLGIFKPDRTQELVGATYGGMDLRSLLRGNSEFRKLALPYLICPGVPIGIVLQENDPIQGGIMRDYLDITQGFGGTIPPIFTDDENIPAGFDGTGVSPVALERTLDGLNVAQRVNSERALFKGGELKVSVMVKGFEVSEDWALTIKQNPTIRDVVFSECGIRVAMQGAAA